MREMDLLELRKQIDRVDTKIVELLDERARIAVQIGAAKQGAPVYNPDREKQVLQNVVAASNGAFAIAELQSIYRQIIIACRNLQ